MSALAGWLTRLGEDGLAQLLVQRPDALLGPRARTVAELAEQLSSPYAVAELLRAAPLPILQVCEALLALGEPARRSDLVDLLDSQAAGTPGQHTEHVDHVLGWLRDRAIVWPADAGDAETLYVGPALPVLLPAPLGLGRSARELVRDIPATTLNKMLTKLGVAQEKSKAATLSAAVAALGDGERVRRLVERADPEVAAELRQQAGGRFETDPFDYDPDRAGRRILAGRWAQPYGLLVGREWGYHWEMPAEVGLALRGADYRAPFDPVPPAVDAHAVPPETAANESAVAALALADRAVSVLDHLARRPAAALKTGGLGVRELDRLGKATGSTETELRLVLELTDELGLLTDTGSGVGVSEEFEAWRRSEPAGRFGQLLATWWALPATPTEGRDEDARRLPALAGLPPCAGCLLGRQGLLGVAARLDPGAAAAWDQLAAAVGWSRPLAHHVARDGGDQLALVWQEAKLLGLVALDSVTDLGRALVGGHRDALVEAAGSILPAATGTAVFGNDLTVLVAGVPTARVSAALDLAADRESHGVAVLWRFSATSVRRALDEGATQDELLARLGDIASAALPQPLRYLVGDVARRHGSIRVRAAVTVVHGDDAALLAQVAADRGLRRLGLRLVAPTVLVAAAEAAPTVDALRRAGYLPVREDGDGSVVLDGQQSAPAPAMAPPAPPPVEAADRAAAPADPRELAARLLAGDPAPAPSSATERLLGQLNRRLGPLEIRVLAHAVDTGDPVVIEYDASSGGRTVRTISDPVLVGTMLDAWCHLRQDGRVFNVSRIRAAHTAGPTSA